MHSVESMKDAMAWELAIKPTMTPAETVGEISDGYHTFNELYRQRVASNALLQIDDIFRKVKP